MGPDPTWVAGLGGAVGVILYAAAEIARRILKSAPKDDPVIKQLRADHEKLKKTLDTEIKFLTLEKDAIVKRLQKVERNGKNGR